MTNTYSCKYRTGKRPLCRHQSLLLVQMGSEWCQKQIRRVGLPKYPSVEYGRASEKVSIGWILLFLGVSGGDTELHLDSSSLRATTISVSRKPPPPSQEDARCRDLSLLGTCVTRGCQELELQAKQKARCSARIFGKGLLSRLQVATYYWVIKSI